MIDGHVVSLCRTHAGRVASERPSSFNEMRALFKELPEGGVPARRSTIDRRKKDDRRVFPPRPEGRRMDDGRRTTDDPGAG